MSPSPPKKTKTTPIKSLKSGENMIDLPLTVVAVEPIRIVKERTSLWSFVASDGHDFVTVTIWNENLIEKMKHELGKDFLNNTFHFRNFAATEIADNYNHGSVPIELKAKDGSSVNPAKKKIGVSEKEFFAYLENKHAICGTDFNPVPLSTIKAGENFIEFKAQFLGMKKRNVPVKGHEATVVDVELMGDKGSKATLTGWNILANFLSAILEGKEGTNISVQGVSFKNNNFRGICFLFNNKSKLEIETPAESGPVENLEDLLGKNGLVAMNVRVKIGRKPVINDIQRKLDGTIVYDGHFKAQLVFPNEIAFEAKEEISVLSSNVVWADSGVLTLNLYSEKAIERHSDVLIDPVDLGAIAYPTLVDE